jgi:hypothetical protein
MGASEWGKPSNALRAKGVEKEEVYFAGVKQQTLNYKNFKTNINF